MTNAELLTKIKVEIGRRIKILREDEVVRQNCTSDFLEGKIYGYEEALSFLSTLESEKPSEELEKEIQKYLESQGVGYGGWIDGWKDEDLREIARHFAQWQKEQMMTEAVELELKDGENVGYPSDWNKVGMVALYFYTPPTFKFGDKVRVIVLPKED